MTIDRVDRRLLLIHGNPDTADRIRALFNPRTAHAYRLAHVTHLPDALAYLEVDSVLAVLVGTPAAGATIEHSIARLRQTLPTVPVIALLDEASTEAVTAVAEAGANDFIRLDCADPEMWLRVVEAAHRQCRTQQRLTDALEELDRLAFVDPLTNLLNRQGMERRLLQALKRCRRTAEKLLVLVIDLDDFSRINVSLGHGVGDLVLINAARRIRETVGRADEIGRVGDDKFMVLMRQHDVEAGLARAENIRLAVCRDQILVGDKVRTVTASGGLIAVQGDALSINEVLTKAHVALQHSKSSGKNRVRYLDLDARHETVRPRQADDELVRSLLREDIFQVAQQPIVNLVDGRIVSREMLVRGPRGPLRSPVQLFRFCEEKDILTPVDLHCLKQATAAAVRFRDGAGFHVNILPSTLLETPPEELVRVLRPAQQRGHCCLEISEQQLLGDPSCLVPRVRVLQQAGIRIAIDDVGFGNSCLEGLILLEPQVMKIDKRLIMGLADDLELRRSLARLLAVADALAVEVVAEGIETREDHRVLLELGARFGQGYLFGRPQICAELAEAAADGTDGGLPLTGAAR